MSSRVADGKGKIFESSYARRFASPCYPSLQAGVIEENPKLPDGSPLIATGFIPWKKGNFGFARHDEYLMNGVNNIMARNDAAILPVRSYYE